MAFSNLRAVKIISLILLSLDLSKQIVIHSTYNDEVTILLDNNIFPIKIEKSTLINSSKKSPLENLSNRICKMIRNDHNEKKKINESIHHHIDFEENNEQVIDNNNNNLYEKNEMNLTNNVTNIDNDINAESKLKFSYS